LWPARKERPMVGAATPRGANRLAAAALAAGIGLIELLGILGAARLPYSGMAITNFLVARVEQGSPAAEAGLAAGDVISSIDGVPATRAYRCLQIMETAGVGETLDLVVLRNGAPLHARLTLRSPPPAERLLRIGLTLVGVVFLLLGLAVYCRRCDRLGLVFFLLCSSFAVLLASSPPIRNPHVHAAYRAMLTAAQMFSPALFLHFFLLFPEGKRTPSRRLLAGIYAPAFALSGISIALFVAGAYGDLRTGRGVTVALDASSSIYFAVCFITGAALFVAAYYRNRSREVRARLRVALWGTVAGVLPVAIVTAAVNLRPELRIPGERFLVFFIVLVPASFAYAIVRHRLLDVQLLIRRSLVYSMLTAALLAVFFLIFTLFGAAVGNLTGRSGLLVSVISIFIVAIMANPLRNKFQSFVDQVFFKKRYDSFRALKELGEALSTAMDLDALVMILVSRISSSLGIKSLAVYVKERTEGEHALELRGGGTSLPRSIKLGEAATALLERRAGPVPLESLRKVRETDAGEDGPTGEGGPREQAATGAVGPEAGGKGANGEPPHEDRGAAAAIEKLERSGLSSAVPFLAWGKLRGLLVLDADSESLPSHQRELLTALAARAGTAIDNAILYREALERHRLEKELAVARRIQEDLLPSRDPVFPSVEISGTMIPSQEVGGDYYDYVMLGEKRIGIALGDVTGKGIPAALVMAAVQATLKADAERWPSPSKLVAVINSRVYQLKQPERFATFFYCCLDAAERTVTYCNAGHHPPVLLRSDGSVERLTEGGLLLGVRPDPPYEEATVKLESGDVLVIFTDGIIEQRREEEFYGEERLIAIMRQNKNLAATRLKKLIVDSVLEFSSDGTNEDDLTLVVIKAY